MSAVFRHPIEILRATTTTNVLGDDVEDWGNPEVIASVGWAVDAGDTRAIGSTAAEAGREGAVVPYTLRHKGLTVDVRGTDRIRHAGKVYRIDGEIIRQPGPTWRTSHTIVALSRATG